jgi:hypothetical protein
VEAPPARWCTRDAESRNTAPRAGLEPAVADATTVAWQVGERGEPVEVVDGDRCHRLWVYRQTQVHCKPGASVVVLPKTPPERNTTAHRAKVKLESLSPDIRLDRPEDPDSLVLAVVRSEHSVSTTCGAVAGGGPFRLSIELSAHVAAQTRSVYQFGSPPVRCAVMLSDRAGRTNLDMTQWFLPKR